MQDPFSFFLASCRVQLELVSATLRPPGPAPSERMRQDVQQLVDAVRWEIGRGQLIPTLGRAATILDQIATTLRWNDGVREILVASVARGVDEAERRYGPQTGRFKRGFVIDVVLDVLSREYLEFPLPRSIDIALGPLVGVVVDWTVEVFNANRGPVWYPHDEPPRLPRRFRRTAATWWRFASTLLRLWARVRSLLIAPSKYEREVRRVAASLSPEVQRLRALLPVDTLAGAAGKVANLILDLGNLTKPHIRTIEVVVRFARTEGKHLLDPEGRHELLVAVIQELLSEAYADEPLIASLINSGLGTFVIGEIVNAIELLLDRADLLPRATEPSPRLLRA